MLRQLLIKVVHVLISVRAAFPDLSEVTNDGIEFNLVQPVVFRLLVPTGIGSSDKFSIAHHLDATIDQIALGEVQMASRLLQSAFLNCLELSWVHIFFILPEAHDRLIRVFKSV